MYLYHGKAIPGRSSLICAIKNLKASSLNSQLSSTWTIAEMEVELPCTTETGWWVAGLLQVSKLVITTGSFHDHDHHPHHDPHHDLPHSPDNGSPPAHNNDVVHTSQHLPVVEQSPAQCGLLHDPSQLRLRDVCWQVLQDLAISPSSF